MMKKFLLLLLLPVFQLFYCQIEFGPNPNHNISVYIATITGSGTIYYTTDGTDPTVNSSFGINNVNVTVSQNIVLKARLKNSNNQLSSVFYRPYYIGELPQKAMYFKPPTSWTNVCSYINYIQPEFMVDFFGPGNNMTPACEGWYKSSFGFYEAVVYFNNCGFGPFYEGVQTITEDIVFYDYSAGPITNPPVCLLAIKDPSKKVAVVKVYPNPVQNFVSIQSENKFLTYEIIDASGKSLVKKNFSEGKINVASLPGGTYFIKLNSLSEISTIVKFIKK